ncbi:MAG: hypothetical protein GTN78_01540, partial [Gemmatimonadales bacterium]|nr:hypothetical protein [Gemmatimonadales bacterium]
MSEAAMEDLLTVAESACEAALKAGAESADAFVERSRELSVSVEKNAIRSSQARLRASISVRAFAAGGTGWSSASTTSEEAAREAGIKAAELAKAAEPDPDFVSLVGPAPYAEVGGLYDEGLASLAGPD